MTVSHTHGDKLSYVAPNTDLASWILARVTGKLLHQLLSDDIWAKLGAERSARYVLDGASMPWGIGGIASTTRDVARFGQMMLQKGRFNGQTIFADTLYTDIVSDGDKDAFSRGPLGKIYADYSYRNYWWIGSDDTIQAKEVMGQTLVIYPDHDVVIVKFAPRKTTTDRDQDILAKKAFDALVKYIVDLD